MAVQCVYSEKKKSTRTKTGVELDQRLVVAREAGHAQAELELGEAALARRARVEHDVARGDGHVLHAREHVAGQQRRERERRGHLRLGRPVFDANTRTAEHNKNANSE